MSWNLCPVCKHLDDSNDGKSTEYGLYGSRDHTECRKGSGIEKTGVTVEYHSPKDALVAELEHCLHADLRRMAEMKGDIYVKEFVTKLPLPF